MQKRRFCEKDLEDWTEKNLSKIESGLKFYRRQVDLGEYYGRLDIIAKDSKNRWVIIELKAPDEIVDEAILSQVLRYRTGLKESKKFRVGDISEVRLICLVNKVSPEVRKILNHAGIGVAIIPDYLHPNFSEIDFPEASISAKEEIESFHAVLPIKKDFFQKLDKYCFYTLNQKLSWVKEGSKIVFCSDKQLKAEASVLSIDRDYKITPPIGNFLEKIRYYDEKGAREPKTLIVHDGLKVYSPPVWWESYLKKFRPHQKFFPEIPMKIDDIELSWIRGRGL